MEPQKSLVVPIALAVLGSAVVFGGLGYYIANTQNATTTITPTQTLVPTTRPTTAVSSTPVSAISPTTDDTTYTNANYGFSFIYPKSWTAQVNENSASTIDLYITGKRPETEGTKTGMIVVKVLDNPKNLTLKEFYSSANGKVNLYDDATKGTQDITVAGVKSVKFNGVVGLEAYNIVSIPYNGKVYEITDNYGLHSDSDGTLEKITATFKFTK